MEELYGDSIQHRYGSAVVLNNVYINCRLGEVVGLLGRNGSGKSTLLKILFGSLKPKYKHLKLDGKLFQTGFITGRIAYLSQEFSVPGYLELKMVVKLYANKYAAELLDIPLITENLDRRIGDLSGGQRRLVECLLVIYSDADYILLDEPFSQLSPAMIEEMKFHIARFKKEKGFIVTDHYYRQILDVSTRIVLLHNGCNYHISTEDDLILHGYLPDKYWKT